MHSFINVIGLSIGMTVAILIGLWMYDELSFDKNFKNYDHIAQVIQNVSNNGEVQTWRQVPYPLANELRTNYGSDFKYIVMGVDWGNHLLTIGDKKLKQTGGFFENQMPDMLTLDMVQGNRNAINNPSSVLISASSAKAYFGLDNPINKIIKIDQMPPVKVAGVYKDFPQNSTFANLNFIASWNFWYTANNYLKDMEDPWRPNFTTLFVQLNNNANINAVNARIRDAKLKKINPQLQKKKPALFLDPMNKWHLYSEYKNGVNVGGAIQFVWLFGIIGVFVLILACINFMNLSTARSEKRAKEVGIRKSVGSRRSQLINQFFCESIVVALMAFVAAIGLVYLALPQFNQVADKKLTLMWSNSTFWLIGLVFSLITGIVAGSYPALYLSSFQPVKVLKGTFRVGRQASVPRQVLVVLQFTVSVTLIIGTIVVFQQIQYAKDRPIGYERNGLINIYLATNDIHDHFEAVRNELKSQGAIAEITESGSPTTQVWNSNGGFTWSGKDPGLAVDFPNNGVSHEYGKTVGWKFKDGRDFSREFASDSLAFVINEAAAKFLGFKNAVGEILTWNQKPYKIIGVIQDMIIESPYEPVRASLWHIDRNNNANLVIIKLNPEISSHQAIEKVKTVFTKYSPASPFEYQFVDEEYARKFSDEERIGKLASSFAVLAIFISCLGIFGLASFVTEQRTKEIGVRKVMGASVVNLWGMLSKDFVVLVIISLLIAMPVAFYFMNSWLQKYDYRTDIAWWIFAASGVGALVITLATVSYQSIKAALANPVKSLRSE